MIKNVTIGDKDVQLDNNVGWALIYRDQFGTDIIPTLTPMFAGVLDIVSGLVQETGKKDEITLTDLAKLADGDALINAIAHVSSLEFVDFINITWALAKNADDTIPDPKTWVRQFDEFPVDVLAPEVVKLIFKGLVSTKNLKRLNDLLKTVQLTPSTSTPSSSQE
jgi:hypothetical protein